MKPSSLMTLSLNALFPALAATVLACVLGASLSCTGRTACTDDNGCPGGVCEDGLCIGAVAEGEGE